MIPTRFFRRVKEMKEVTTVKQRDIDVVFWENVERYLNQAQKTHADASRELDFPVNFFTSFKKRKELPQAKRVQKLCDYLDLQYVDLFEDWGNAEDILE